MKDGKDLPAGGGRYRNPILMADYSDPDVIRVGESYYMVASSFTYLPGVPLLRSEDMIHWRQIAWCVEHLPFARYEQPAHGCGTWAPAIRRHGGRFYVFVPLPDEGIFVTTASDPAGPWSPLHCLWEGKGWIDPCPFWDADGRAYLVHAFANSRCGIKHRIDICPMAPDASALLGEGVTAYLDPEGQPTMEGPKMYRRGAWYYIFAPAGGVERGWQTVLRSRDPLGPYEARVVLHQGKTAVNGPHQGAWVTTPAGEDWFYHFQDRGVYGRVLHLQPVRWVEDWPVIGEDRDGDGVGEPVEEWPLPLPERREEDEKRWEEDFRGERLSLGWQWQADPREEWYRLGGGLHLKILPCRRGESLLWYMPNVLSRVGRGEAYTMEATLALEEEGEGDEAGVAVLGHRYSSLALRREGAGWSLRLSRGWVTETSPRGKAEEEEVLSLPWPAGEAVLCLTFGRGGQISYSCRLPGGEERALPGRFQAERSSWSGARPALFARNREDRPGGSGLFRKVVFREEDPAPEEISPCVRAEKGL